ncbi:MAG: Hsp70 family protein, partial [Clostridia bacterium]|nr:Hsp70 family protein [Clostridia bacterium]
VNVSAKDLGTGREQHITITSNTNMSKEDVEKAVKEAEQYASEDKARREAVDTRNNADQMVYQCEKTIEEMGDKMDEADKTELQGKIEQLKEVLKGEDIEAIKAKQEELTKAFYAVSEKIYQANAPQGGPVPGAEQAPDGTAAPDSEGYYNGDVQ